MPLLIRLIHHVQSFRCHNRLGTLSQMVWGAPGHCLLNIMLGLKEHVCSLQLLPPMQAATADQAHTSQSFRCHNRLATHSQIDVAGCQFTCSKVYAREHTCQWCDLILHPVCHIGTTAGAGVCPKHDTSYIGTGEASYFSCFAASTAMNCGSWTLLGCTACTVYGLVHEVSPRAPAQPTCKGHCYDGCA